MSYGLILVQYLVLSLILSYTKAKISVSKHSKPGVAPSVNVNSQSQRWTPIEDSQRWTPIEDDQSRQYDNRENSIDDRKSSATNNRRQPFNHHKRPTINYDRNQTIDDRKQIHYERIQDIDDHEQSSDDRRQDIDDRKQIHYERIQDIDDHDRSSDDRRQKVDGRKQIHYERIQDIDDHDRSSDDRRQKVDDRKQIHYERIQDIDDHDRSSDGRSKEIDDSEPINYEQIQEIDERERPSIDDDQTEIDDKDRPPPEGRQHPIIDYHDNFEDWTARIINGKPEFYPPGGPPSMRHALTTPEPSFDLENLPPIHLWLNHNKDEPAHRNDNHSIADHQAKRVRVLCWVMTYPDNHKTKAVHVKATWGKRCNKLIFMSSQADDSLPAIALEVVEGKYFLWSKTKEAFRYVYKHHRTQYDWFMKADDDTYVIVENLRYLLAKYNTAEPIYLGRRYEHRGRGRRRRSSYMTGGAGYILSRAALELLVTRGLNTSNHVCKEDDWGPLEDIDMGSCMELLGVKAIDTRDSQGRELFFQGMPLDVENIVHYCPVHCPYYPVLEGEKCCSDRPVSFHGIKPMNMYALEYLVYHLRRYQY